jgi:ankyrin repeat protein
VNARETTRSQTALMWAATQGHAPVIQTLLEAGADIHAASHAPAAAAASVGYGTYRRTVGRVDVFTPLMFAVRGGHLDAVRALLEGGADVNETLPNGTSALVLAVFNAHYELAAFLLDQGADPNAAQQGWTALHQLVRTRNLNIGFFPHPEPTGRMSGLELGQKLIEHRADVNARMTKPIVDGFRGFWVQKDATPLLLAAKGGDAAMMRLLAAHGADPSLANAKGTTPLMAASGVEMFNPNEDSGTNEDGLEALKVALELGGDVNAANKDGDTPLHGAAWRGANDIVQLLVDHGAKLDVKNKQGYTPLRIANGEEERVANHNVRPWTVELLLKLLTERGLPTDMLGPEGRHAYEKQVADEKSRPRRNDQPREDQSTEPPVQTPK